MYKRDFGILLLSVCAVYLSLQNEGPFTFKKAWYHHFVLDDEITVGADRLPTPVVADLNGDGKPEVLAAAPGNRLLVLAPRRPGDGFAAAQVLASLQLPAPLVALRAGHLTPPPGDLVRAPRKQVVVAVTADLQVRCLDHNLKPLWARPLGEHFPQGAAAREAAVLVTHHAAGKGSRGAVVVGLRAAPPTLAERLAAAEAEGGWGEDEGGMVGEGAERERRRARGRARDAALAELQAGGGEGSGSGAAGRHFSYFALAGGDGAVGWKHEALDFHRDLGDLQGRTVRSQEAAHEAAQAEEGVHYGEASCREYREAVLAALPHGWHSPHDTSLGLAHFHKHRAARGAQKERLSTLAAGGAQRGGAGAQASPAPVARVLGSLAAGGSRALSSASAPPHSLHASPNVVVAHLQEGLEAVHLFSGRPVCRLHLPAPGVHVDLNGDGVPDHMHAVGGSPADLAAEAAEQDADSGGRHAHHTFCAAVVTTGIPPKEHLFNGTVCRAVGSALKRRPGLGQVEVAPPAALPVPGRHGHYRASTLRQKSIALFLNSRGEVTAYDSAGALLWQVYAGTSWRAARRDGAPPDDGDDDDGGQGGPGGEGRAPAPRFRPTLLPLALRRHAIPSVVVAAGQEDATVLSEHGHELAWVPLPEAPAHPLLALDFNLDGYTDLVMVGRGGLYGWAQVRRPGAVPFAALVAGLIVTMAAVFVTQQGFMQAAGRPKGRSTERVD